MLLEHIRVALRSTARTGLEGRRLQVRRLADLLGSISPLAVLARGYAICRGPGDSVLRRSDAVRAGDPIRVMLHRGGLECEVRRVHAPVPEEA